MIDKNSMLPIYYQLKEHIITQIKARQICPNDKLISENEMASLYGISRQPIIRAMNDLEKEGWIYRVQGKGSFCAAPKEDLYKNVGIVLNTLENYIGGQIIDGITHALSQRDYNGIVRNVRYSPTLEYETVLDMIQNNAAGFILNTHYKFSTLSRRKGVLREIEKRGIPFIIADATFDDSDIPCISVDDVKGGYIATKHLLESGHRNIMFFAPHIGWAESARIRGYTNALTEYGVTPNEEYLVYGILNEFSSDDKWRLEDDGTAYDITKTGSFGYIRRVLEAHPQITAAVCYNDLYATLLIENLAFLGRQVPKDISIVSFDDSAVAVSGGIPLTSVSHPKFGYGARAANVLLDILEGKKPRDYQEVMDVELVVRQSTLPV